MADVTIAGKKIPRWVVFAGAGGVLVAGYLWWKNRNASSSSSSSSTDPNAIDPVTGLPYSEDDTVDPLTGLTYLQEAEQYGSVSAAEAAYAGQSATDTATGDTGSTSNVGTTSTTSSAAYSSNTAWGSAAISALEAMGYSATDATTAIYAYLDGQTLTSGESTLVQLATNEIGSPPTPIAIQTSPSGSSGSGSASGGAPSSGPVSSSKWQYPAPENLTAESGGSGKINVSWAHVVGPQGQIPPGYTVAYGRTSGAQTWKNTVSGTSTTLTTQKGMTEYIEVWANGGPVAPPHAGPVKATAGS